jgi:hypothetical protein
VLLDRARPGSFSSRWRVCITAYSDDPLPRYGIGFSSWQCGFFQEIYTGIGFGEPGQFGGVVFISYLWCWSTFLGRRFPGRQVVFGCLCSSFGGAVFVLVSSCCFSPSGCFVFVFVAVCSLFCSSFKLSRHLVSCFSCPSFVSRGLHFILFYFEVLGLESLFGTLPRVE